MRFHNILLCRLAYAGDLGNVSMPPVGLAYLSESLLQAGIDHDTCDLALHPQKFERKRLFEELHEKKPDALGVSMMTLGYTQHYELLNDIKTAFPDIPIIVGGAHMSTFREKVLQECHAVDYGIVREGEESLVDVCLGKPEEQIKGLYYRKHTHVAWTTDDHYITELDALNFPRYAKFSMDAYEQDIPIVTSRGCPFSCTFCPVATAIGRRFRARSPQSILQEIEWWYARGFRRYSIWDDNFTMIRERVVELCDLLKQSDMTGLYFRIPNGVRADRIDKALLQHMWDVGFRQVSLGVESGVNHVLQHVKKAESVEQIEQAIQWTTEIGYEVYLYFIIGLPGERYEDFLVSKRLATRYDVAEARFYNLVPFPGTELYEWAKEHEYLVKTPDVYLNRDYHFENNPNVETPEMSVAERQKAFREGVKVTHRQKKKFKLHQYRQFGPLGHFFAIMTLSTVYQKFFKPAWLRKYVMTPVKQYLRHNNERT